MRASVISCYIQNRSIAMSPHCWCGHCVHTTCQLVNVNDEKLIVYNELSQFEYELSILVYNVRCVQCASRGSQAFNTHRNCTTFVQILYYDDSVVYGANDVCPYANHAAMYTFYSRACNKNATKTNMTFNINACWQTIKMKKWEMRR